MGPEACTGDDDHVGTMGQSVQGCRGQEKAAMDFASAAASVPNAVTDELIVQLRQHWDDGQIVEIMAVIALFGFLNRWNDSMATPL
jgi:alkylhydroperoxidase family enzyme